MGKVQCVNCASLNRALSRCWRKNAHVHPGRHRWCSLFSFAKVIKQRRPLPAIRGFWQGLLKKEEDKKRN